MEPKIVFSTDLEKVQDEEKSEVPLFTLSPSVSISTLPQLEQYRLKNAPPSMFYIPSFLGAEDQQKLLDVIKSGPPEKWVLGQCYKECFGRAYHPEDGHVVLDGGDLTDWTEQFISCVSPIESLFFDGPTNHFVTVNKYIPGQGLVPHKDFKKTPVIIILTLNAPGLLDFHYPLSKRETAKFDNAEIWDRYHIGTAFLEPGSLFIFTDTAFEVLLHGIKKVRTDVIHEKIWNRPDHLAIGTQMERGMRFAVGK